MPVDGQATQGKEGGGFLSAGGPFATWVTITVSPNTLYVSPTRGASSLTISNVLSVVTSLPSVSVRSFVSTLGSVGVTKRAYTFSGWCAFKKASHPSPWRSACFSTLRPGAVLVSFHH